MSGAHPPQQPGTPAQGAAADPSMEDILASIRRILNDDEQPPAPAPRPEPAKPADDVIPLETSMIVEAPTPPPPPPTPRPPISPLPAAVPPSPGLIAPETEAAVASTMGGLLRTLGEHVPVHRGGPTIEDIVREEMRPMLKQWLDTHLQALVERQVRAEIERIVGRTVS